MRIFAPVPLELLMDKRLTLRQFRLMVALLSFCPRGKNECFPSRELLAERASMSVARVSQTTAQLVELGWLAKDGNGGRGRATRYTILLPVTVTEPVTVTDSVTVTESVPVCDAQIEHDADEETVTEPVTVTETVTDKDPTARNGYRIGTKTVTESVTPIEHTRNRQGVLNPPLIPPRRKQSAPKPQPWADVTAAKLEQWLAHRRAMGCKKPWTPEAQARHEREAEKAGLTSAQAIDYATGAQWQAFTASYYFKAEDISRNGGGYKSAQEKRAESHRRWLFETPAQDENTIDVSATMHGEQILFLGQQQ